MSKRPVYMHEITNLADSLGDQMEVLAKRAVKIGCWSSVAF